MHFSDYGELSQRDYMESFNASYIKDVLERMELPELLKARTLDKTWKQLADEEIVHRHTIRFGHVDKSISMRIKDLTLGELELKLAPIPSDLYGRRFQYGLDGILDPNQTSCIWYGRDNRISYTRIGAKDLLNYLGRLVEAYPEDTDKLKRGFYQHFNNVRLRLQRLQRLQRLHDERELDTMNKIMDTPEAHHYLNTPGPGPSSSRLFEIITSRSLCRYLTQRNVIKDIKQLQVKSYDQEYIIRGTLNYGMQWIEIDRRDHVRFRIRHAIEELDLTEDEQRMLWHYYEYRCRALNLNPNSTWTQDQPELGAMAQFSNDIYDLYEGAHYLDTEIYHSYDRMITAFLKLATSDKNVNLASVRRRTASGMENIDILPISELYVRQRIGDRINHLPETEQQEIVELLALASILRMNRFKIPINTD